LPACAWGVWSLANYVLCGRPTVGACLGMSNARIPRRGLCPAALAAGLTRRSPLKGLGTPGSMGGRSGYAGMSPSQPLQWAYQNISPAALAPGTGRVARPNTWM